MADYLASGRSGGGGLDWEGEEGLGCHFWGVMVFRRLRTGLLTVLASIKGRFYWRLLLYRGEDLHVLAH